jgi:CheY-like chemotaxis protein
MRIAYVEDNATNVALIERILRIKQHVLTSYADGETALDALLAEPQDVILVDVELASDMTGLDLVRRLRERGTTTTIIAVTAYAMVGDREKCMAAGCNDYLAKPIAVTDLLGLLEKHEQVSLAKTAGDTATENSPTPLPA